MRATGSYYVVDAKRKQEEPFLASRLPSSKTRTTFVKKEGDGGGTTKAARQYRFAGNPDIEIERSEAAQDAALPDQCVVCRRLSLKMRAKLKSCYLSYDAISDKHSKRTRERGRERQRARVRA